jgi:hypothetical protein
VNGDVTVIDIRMTALADAIRARDWEAVEFQFDRVRSSLDRAFGTRNRPVDVVRKEHSDA